VKSFTNTKNPLLLPVAFCLLLTAALAVGQTGTWTFTSDMAGPRRDHTATLLANGRVLVVGWQATAELYDPATGTFSATAPTVAGHGAGSSATLLNDGRVLIVGGNAAEQVAELYDPTTGTFALTAHPNERRGWHSATLLADGRVLIAGGQHYLPYPTPPPEVFLQSLTSAEIYDPASATFTLTGSMHQDRTGHAASRLPDGRVLVVGGTMTWPDQPGYGECLASAEIYDPASGAFSMTASMADIRCDLWCGTAPVLANGTVLIASNAENRAELYDPASATFSPTGNMVEARGAASVTKLSDGRVLVAGGWRYELSVGGAITLPSAEIYDPATGTFSATAAMNSPRQQHTATLLPDGRVLATGGWDFAINSDLASAELFTYRPPVIEVEIAFRPGGGVPVINCRNDKMMLTLPILSTPTFDATTIDHTTVRFGPAMASEAHEHGGVPKRHEDDINGDGLMDLVFHFRFGATGIACGDTQAILTGSTFDGRAIQGTVAFTTRP